MSVSPENLDRDIAAIKKRRGMNPLKLGSDQRPIDRIPIDSPALMRITSGGIPLGRITRLWGGPSSGKSLLGWMIIKASQEFKISKFPLGLETCYWDIEKQYEPNFTRDLGVNIDRMHINESDIIEDIAREIQLLLGSIHVHVLDSCSEAKPQDRLAKDPGDWDVGLKIRVWEKALEFIMNALDKEENAIIAIEHASRDFKTKSEKPLGGKEWEHKSGLSIQCKKTKWLYYDEEGLLQTEDKLAEKGIMGIGGQKEADGQEIVVQVSKSRVCKPFRKGHMRLDLNTYKFDHTFELMQGAEYFDKDGNVAHRSGTPAIAHRTTAKGGWATLPNGQKVQGERNLRLMLDSDKDLADLVRKAMLKGN